MIPNPGRCGNSLTAGSNYLNHNKHRAKSSSFPTRLKTLASQILAVLGGSESEAGIFCQGQGNRASYQLGVETTGSHFPPSKVKQRVVCWGVAG